MEAQACDTQFLQGSGESAEVPFAQARASRLSVGCARFGVASCSLWEGCGSQALLPADPAGLIW